MTGRFGKDLSDATRNGVKYGNMLGVPFLFCLYGVIRCVRENDVDTPFCLNFKGDMMNRSA